MLKKTKHTKFSKSQTFLATNVHTYKNLSRGTKCLLFEKFGVPCFLAKPVLSSTVLPYYRQNGAILIYLNGKFYSKRLTLDFCEKQ